MAVARVRLGSGVRTHTHIHYNIIYYSCWFPPHGTFSWRRRKGAMTAGARSRSTYILLLLFSKRPTDGQDPLREKIASSSSEWSLRLSQPVRVIGRRHTWTHLTLPAGPGPCRVEINTLLPSSKRLVFSFWATKMLGHVRGRRRWSSWSDRCSCCSRRWVSQAT